MHSDSGSGLPFFSRRKLLQAAAAGAGCTLLPGALPAEEVDDRLRFVPDGRAFRFDTGALRGIVREGGQSLGLRPVEDVSGGILLSRSMGLCSHYRLLDDRKRYGEAGWDWSSQATLLADGALRVQWAADDSHPFSMQAIYRWSAPQTLDVRTTVQAVRPLQNMEVFLASYFEGFAPSYAYVKQDPGSGGAPGMMQAERSRGVWQMFPRDAAAVAMIKDGRWERPPHPVDWTIMPKLAGPLGMRRDAASGLTALVMSRPADCFAVATPYSEESHRSLYLSLFGCDLAEGESATANARLIVDREISDARAIELYEAYAAE